MNFWQVQAAARRKNRARNDILGLLENSQRRKRTSKKAQSVIRKQFGIFAKSLSFNVRLIDENENEPIENDTSRTAPNGTITHFFFILTFIILYCKLRSEIRVEIS